MFCEKELGEFYQKTLFEKRYSKKFGKNIRLFWQLRDGRIGRGSKMVPWRLNFGSAVVLCGSVAALRLLISVFVAASRLPAATHRIPYIFIENACHNFSEAELLNPKC